VKLRCAKRAVRVEVSSRSLVEDGRPAAEYQFVFHQIGRQRCAKEFLSFYIEKLPTSPTFTALA